jgi:PBP1b-binding outer membrane lipoprotein LpoB
MKNPKKKIQSAAVSIALLIAGGISIRAQTESSREAADDVARPQTSSPTDFVDTPLDTFLAAHPAAQRFVTTQEPPQFATPSTPEQ